MPPRFPHYIITINGILYWSPFAREANTLMVVMIAMVAMVWLMVAMVAMVW